MKKVSDFFYKHLTVTPEGLEDLYEVGFKRFLTILDNELSMEVAEVPKSLKDSLGPSASAVVWTPKLYIVWYMALYIYGYYTIVSMSDRLVKKYQFVPLPINSLRDEKKLLNMATSCMKLYGNTDTITFEQTLNTFRSCVKDTIAAFDEADYPIINRNLLYMTSIGLLSTLKNLMDDSYAFIVVPTVMVGINGDKVDNSTLVRSYHILTRENIETESEKILDEVSTLIFFLSMNTNIDLKGIL